ncbi:MAG: DNA replication complex subunit Gins51 [Promethearchaeota archaeon]
MDLKKDYDKLYNHWFKEYEQPELTHLTQDIFDNYKKSLSYITQYQVEEKPVVEFSLFTSYKKRFTYLFNDFLKIREVKILNYALSLKDIDLNDVIEAEKLFFQNLVSTIKGYKKLKKLALYDDQEPLELEEILINDEKLEIIPPIKESAEEYSIETSINSQPEKVEISKPNNGVNYKYMLIRFNEPSPPLVGIDLINYGPFQINDITNMPYKNAKILIYEKIAEKIELS